MPPDSGDTLLVVLRHQYQGALGARSAWRAEVVRLAGAAEAGALDVLACGHCGGRLRLIARIEQSTVTTRILRHLGLPMEVPSPRAGRSPPTAGSSGADPWTW